MRREREEDLRSPLNTILISAGAIEHDPLPPETARKLERLVSAVKRMERVVGDLTDYTKRRATGTLQLHRERVDLRELVTLVAGELQAKGECRVKVDCVGDATGEWDRSRLLRSIVNLVNNPLAYGAPSTPIVVQVEGDEAWAALRVHNEGDPIPADTLPHLFDPFTRGTKSAGSGLGPYIVHEIVAAHGGSIVVESTREKGTTFTVRLPRWRAVDAAGWEPRSPDRELHAEARSLAFAPRADAATVPLDHLFGQP